MNITFFTTLAKGFETVTKLIAAGKNAIPVVTALKDLATAAQTNDVTDDQLAATEALLDAALDDFNTPL